MKKKKINNTINSLILTDKRKNKKKRELKAFTLPIFCFTSNSEDESEAGFENLMMGNSQTKESIIEKTSHTTSVLRTNRAWVA